MKFNVRSLRLGSALRTVVIDGTMKSKVVLSSLFVVLGFGLGVGCGDDGGDDGAAGASAGTSGMGGMGGASGASGMGGGGEPTWSAIYSEIIVGTGCNGGAFCHGGNVGNLPMLEKDATYAALVDVDAMGTNLVPGTPNCVDSGLKRIVSGDPDSSLLVAKIEGTQECGMQMGALTEAQITQIRTWIQNGALDN